MHSPESTKNLPNILTKHRDLFILLAICFLCFFFRLGAIGLFDFNEGLYAQAAREMALRGDFVTPRANGIFFFDKPPLTLWLSALAFKMFGYNEFAARLPIALAATALSLLTWAFGKRFFNARVGLFAGMMVALNPMMIGTARQMTMDIHQSFWFAVAMISFYLGWIATDNRGKRWYYGISIGCGLSVLAKSVPGLFPLVAILVFLMVEEKWKWKAVLGQIRRAKPLVNLLLLIAVVAPWHYLAWKANGQIFYEEYWLLHHVQLLNGKDFNHSQPIWYYIPMLFAGLFPWSIYLPWAVKRRDDSDNPEADKAQRFLFIWAITVFVIFTLMKSKLISYLLPMYAPASLLVALWIDRTLAANDQKASRPIFIGSSIITLTGIAGIIAGPVFTEKAKHSARLASDIAKEVPPPVWSWIQHSMLVAAIGGIVSLIFIKRKQMEMSVWAVFGTMSLFILLATTEGLNAMQASKMEPLHSISAKAGRMAEEGSPLAIHIGTPRHPSVFFYLPDALFLKRILPDGVVENGILLERGEIEPIIEFVNSHPGAIVLTDTGRGEKLIEQIPTMKVIEKSGRWELLTINRVQLYGNGGSKP